MKKAHKIGAVAVVAALAAGILWRVSPWTSETGNNMVEASGIIDATEIGVAFRATGTLRSRPIQEGSLVRAGQLLAELDDRETGARLRQAEAAALAGEAKLKDMERGYRPQEVAEAKAQVEQAQATLGNLNEESKRSDNLYQGGAISRQRLEKDRTAATVALQQLKSAQERLKLLQSGFRPESIAVARAQLKEAQAAAEVARVAWEDMRVKSPADGVITRTHAETGEILAAGRPVATVTDLSRPWVRVYIPENRIGMVRLGAKAKIRIDTYPDRTFDGQVTYVSSQAEFTPKNVQTQEERVKLVFAVNVTAENVAGALKPGMPADVYIAVPAEAGN